MLYDWLRALHIIAVIAWMAGLMMLPRLYVYHFKAEAGSVFDATLIEAERRLVTIILNPALFLVWGMGLSLLFYGETNNRYGWPFEPWLWAKLVLVVGLSGVHGMLTAARRRFAAGDRPKSERYWRILNEVPMIIAIGVVILAVVEPR